MKNFIIIVFLSISLVSQAQRGDTNFNNIQAVWQLINTFYVDTVDRQALSREVIVSMLKKLDPHSVFIPSEEVQSMNEQLEGNFEGVGVEFSIMNDTLMVVNAIIDGPSEKVGITSGDRIIAIDGKNVASIGIKNADVFKMLRGKKGTTVDLTVLRKGIAEPMQFHVTRDKIPINSIDAAYMITPQTGYIKISRFSLNTYDEFMTELKKLKQSKLQNIIVDLRGNGGGYMTAALNIADEFIESGKLMLYTEGNLSPRQDFDSQKGGLFEKGRIVILIDESSASASEIVSGAIQDWDRGVIIGRRSFGKGLVQRQFKLHDDSELRLTTARYYTPSGRSIQKYYDEDLSKYRKEIGSRFEHGELTNPDSIHQREDLIYKTLKNKRTVYGGGGITPDIFVPLDTSMFTVFYRDLLSLGVYNRFMMKYIDENRNVLANEYKSFEQFNSKYIVEDTLFEQLLAEAEKSEINIDEEQVAISESHIRMQMKAFIARHLWSVNEYYKIVNQSVQVIQTAVKLIEDKKGYNEALEGN